jgi:4-hydroxybenzoate polyprenyltransferase
MLALSLNRLTVLLSVPALLLAVSYPYTKRYLAIPQAYLGIAFGFGIPMTFAAQLESVPAVAWWLLFANIFWAIAYDTAYAMVDRDDDVRIGIHSSALFFGRYDVAAIMACYAMTLITLFAIGWSLGFGFVYYIALCCAASIATYHYTLIRGRQREACFKAFIHNTWFGATVFLGIALDQLFHLPASLP